MHPLEFTFTMATHRLGAQDRGTAQRAFLLRLDRLTDQESDALTRGDLAELARLSEERAALVRAAGGYIPPAVAWADEVGDLAAEVGGRAAAVCDAIRDCIAELRREVARSTAHRPRPA